MKKIIGLGLLLSLSFWAAADEKIQEYKLSNGMKVVVQEDHRSPVVVSQVWYRAGSVDELNGTTGVAHVLEHMMFKGTPKVPAGQFSRIIASAGGRDNWYATWYAPNNATLVVVGDVNSAEVFKLAQQYFGPLKPHKLAERKPQIEPDQKGEHRVVVKAPAKLSYLLMGYPVPSLRDAAKDWEPYALEILAGVMDGNASSRLSRHLVRRDQIAVDVSVGYDMINRGNAQFTFDGTPSEGTTVSDLENAIRGEIESIKQEGVTEEELQRVKAQVIASDVYKRDSMFYQAMQIGQMESTGLGWRALEDYPKRLQAVTVEQVQAVARKYLDDDKLTVATLDPQPIDQNRPKHREFTHVR